MTAAADTPAGAAANLRAVWREDRALRWFFAAHLQSALGAGAGYVALLLLAYERIGSAWAATAVLLADLLPAMLLGPVVGGLVDRGDRLRWAIVADVLRAAAFAGIVLVPGIPALVGFALLAGLGTAVFRPATCALLPALVEDRRLPAANAVYDVVRNTGMLLGPACAGALLLISGPEWVLAVNAGTFAASALLLAPLRRRGTARPPDPEAPATTLRAEAAEGLRVVLADPVTRTLVATSGGVMLTTGMMNVAELVLAQRELSAGGTGYALLVCAYGFGLVAGSLRGAGETGLEGVKRRYLAGLALMCAGMLGSALAGTVTAAMVTFAITGAGNGLFVVSDRVLIQRLVPARLHGRAFGLLDALDSWGFAGAVLAGGALAGAAGGRVTFAVAGMGATIVGLAAVGALRRAGALVEAPLLRPADPVLADA